MNCPKCGVLTDNKICPECKTDILQYTLIDKMSFDAYNKGLTLAKENDISGAISELKKSIKYNKTNITALNLLGVCYDRVGRIADASKYWIMSCLTIEDNVANDYLKNVEDKSSQREKLNESIKMYNQALVYLKQNSLDIAIIQLRNSIDRNPKLIEAHNLLALVYIKSGEKDKAIGLLKKVLKIDSKNEKALRYLEAVNYKFVPYKNNAKAPKEQKNIVREERTTNLYPKQAKNNSLFISKQSVISFGLGLVLMLLIYVFIVIPNLQSDIVASSIESEKGYKDQLSQQTTVISSKDSELLSLKEENEKLKTENATLKQDYAVLNVTVAMNKAEEFIKANDFKSAADAIGSISPDLVKAEQIDRYNSLKNQSYPLASKALYDSGITKYDQKKYQEALDDFQLSIKFGGTDKIYYPSTLFYIGRCYEGLGNNEQAKVYYEKIISEFPNNDSVYSAKSRLDSIGQ